MTKEKSSKKKKSKTKTIDLTPHHSEKKRKKKRKEHRERTSETGLQPRLKRKMGKKVKEVKEKLDKGESLISAFKNKEIMALLDTDKNDSAISLTRKQMLRTIIDLIPMAEESYRKFPSDRNVYALNNLMSQAREIIAELQSDTDRDLVLHRLTSNVISPQASLLANYLIEANFSLKNRLKSYVTGKSEERAVGKLIDDMTKEIGSALKESLEHISKGVAVVLNEN
ncbi:MAG: hypothetical protein WC967_09345 [Balneolaceae bacterium]